MKLCRDFAGLVLLLCLSAMVQAEYVKYKDPKQPLDDRIRDLLKRMTLEEKIGQMLHIDRSVASTKVMQKYYIGSVLSGGGSVPAQKAPPNVWVDMVNSFQQGALSTRLGIPMIYGIDALHGHNNVYNATIFPHNIGLGCTRDPDLVKRIGAATALEARATGIPYVYAPCVSVCRDRRWGRCYESFSEDPAVVKLLTDIIPGLQGDKPNNTRKIEKTKVACCVKHFVGDGGTTKGIDASNTVIDRHGLFSIHMPGFSEAVNKGISTVMVAYSSLNGVKMHANKELITGYLKDTLHFKIMVPYKYKECFDTLTHLVKVNAVSMSRIDDAVQRILRVKFEMGLFENPMADYSLADKLGSQEHRELAREAVRKSLVLLKNGKHADKPVIPLPKKAHKILVAGTHADNLGYQCGGWTIEWQGVNGNNHTTGTTILSAIKNTVDPQTEVIYQENPNTDFVKNGNFSYAIVVVGELPYAESAGDSQYLSVAEPGTLTMWNVCMEVKCVVVFVSGRPLQMDLFDISSDAIVAAWLPGSEGQGVADVLFGDYGFTGKLANTWFKTVEQLPMNVGDKDYDPLWPYGFGIVTKAVKST